MCPCRCLLWSRARTPGERFGVSGWETASFGSGVAGRLIVFGLGVHQLRYRWFVFFKTTLGGDLLGRKHHRVDLGLEQHVFMQECVSSDDEHRCRTTHVVALLSEFLPEGLAYAVDVFVSLKRASDHTPNTRCYH